MTARPTVTVEPPFTLYALSVAPTTQGSPAAPAVSIVQADDRGRWVDQHVVTPQQARDMAAGLLRAADLAERRA